MHACHLPVSESAIAWRRRSFCVSASTPSAVARSILPARRRSIAFSSTLSFFFFARIFSSPLAIAIRRSKLSRQERAEHRANDEEAEAVADQGVRALAGDAFEAEARGKSEEAED